MTPAALDDLVQRAVPAELLAEVDRLCAARDWDGLVKLRDACEAAVEFGKQLWSVAQFADYRLALEAPGEYAGAVCRAGAGRFALGPLTEVAASTHAWEDLADHLTEPWIAATVAQERVLRGEDLADDERARPHEADVPLRLLPFEPDYPLPTYRPYELLEGGPEPVGEGFNTVEASPGAPRDLRRVRRAVQDVVAAWTDASNGGSRLVVTDGDAYAAAAAIGDGVGIAQVPVADVLARLAWTGASGGALGRRRGMAAGRSAALWFLTVAGELEHGAEPDGLAAAASRLDWYVLDAGPMPWIDPADDDLDTRGSGGWRLSVAVADPANGWALAVDAWDRPLAGMKPPGRFVT